MHSIIEPPLCSETFLCPILFFVGPHKSTVGNPLYSKTPCPIATQVAMQRLIKINTIHYVMCSVVQSAKSFLRELAHRISD